MIIYLTWIVLIILPAGDVELNPGPQLSNHTYSSQNFSEKRPTTHCHSCNLWTHKKCLHMSYTLFKTLASSSSNWMCSNCGIPNFTSSFFKSENSNLTNRLDYVKMTNKISLLSNQNTLQPQQINQSFKK